MKGEVCSQKMQLQSRRASRGLPLVGERQFCKLIRSTAIALIIDSGVRRRNGLLDMQPGPAEVGRLVEQPLRHRPVFLDRFYGVISKKLSRVLIFWRITDYIV